MNVLSETNKGLVRIMAGAGVSIKKRRAYIEDVNCCLIELWEYPELLYTQVESFISEGLKGEELEEEIDKYLNQIGREIAEFGSRNPPS